MASPAFFKGLHSQFDDDEMEPLDAAPAVAAPAARPTRPREIAPLGGPAPTPAVAAPTTRTWPALTTNRPPTTRPPVPSTNRTGPGMWTPGQGDPTRGGGASARQWLAERGYAVGRSAQKAQPGAQGMSWADIARMAGVTDFKGAKKDERFRAIQDAFYGHNQAGSAAADPERTAYRQAIEAYMRDHPGEFAPGAGGAGGAGGPGGAGGGGGEVGFEDELEQLLRSGMRGEDGPYSEDVRNNMRASAKEDTAGSLAATNKLANIAAARSGNLYSGSTGETLAENARASDASLNRQYRDMDVQGASANFDAKLKSRDQALSLLQQRKEEAMANARNAIDRERIKNDYDVAIQGIAVQREQIAAQKEAADSAARAEMASGRAWREHELTKMNTQRQWDVEDYANRELPMLLGEYGG